MTQPGLFPDAPPPSAEPTFRVFVLGREINVPQALARASDPPSSHKAADKVEGSGRANTHRMMCLTYVRTHPGGTSAECAQRYGLDRHEAARRLPELRRAGLIENGPARVCAVTGNKSITWRPTPKYPPPP